MNLVPLLCKASAVLLILFESSSGTNFPPVSKQVPISFPPQQNVPLDFVSDAIIPETPITNFQPAERLPDSFVVTESTTERPAASDQIPYEASLPKAVADDWSPPSGTIGPVATPRPDSSEVPAPFVPEKEKVRPFPIPVPKQDNTRTPLPPSVWVFSRGVTGHYAEQGWIPFDSTFPRGPPFIQGQSSNQEVRGNFPTFSTPVRPGLVFQPDVSTEWIPPPSNIPRSVPENVPFVIIHNVTVPTGSRPPSTVINIPLSSEIPPLQYFQKPVIFPPPKTFVFANPPAGEAPVKNPPVKNPPVKETPAPPEVTTTAPTTTLPPPPSPPPPPPPPPPTYFIVPQKKEMIPIFPPLFVPPTQLRFTPPETVQPLYYPKTSDDSQFSKTFLPSQYKIPVFSPTINAWIPGPNILKSQFAPRNAWYDDPTGYNKQKPIGPSSLDETSSTVTGTQKLPPLSSDLWIIKGPANNIPKGNVPVSTPAVLMPKLKVVVPVRENVFSPILDQEVVPTFSGMPAAYSIYPAQINSSSFYRFSRNMPSPMPLLRLYLTRPKQPPSSFIPAYSSEPSSQLDSFPVSVPYPIVPYPFVSQPRQAVQVRPVSNKENCTTPARPDVKLIPPPANFYVQSPTPVYLPMPQNSFPFFPVRPEIPEVPAAVFRTDDSRPSPVIETPVAQEDEKRKETVPAEKPFPSSPEVSAADNVVISPVFPFINPPISFPKPVAANDNLKRPPYFFRYGQTDGQGTMQFRSEEADSDGLVKGSYGYRGADGIFRKVDYTADSGRYRAVAAANEPNLPNQQRPDPVIMDNENYFVGTSQEKIIAESEP